MNDEYFSNNYLIERIMYRLGLMGSFMMAVDTII